MESRSGEGAEPDGDDAPYHLPDDSQADSDHVILETECPSLDDLNFTPRVQGSHVSASRPSFQPQFMQTAVPPCFFPTVSCLGFFRGPFADAGAIQHPRAMPTFSHQLYDDDEDYGQPMHLGMGLNLNGNFFPQD